MDNSLALALGQAQLAARTESLQTCNDVSQRYGLSLSDRQLQNLIVAENETLRAYGRLEFGEGILPRLMYSFCDSPYSTRDSWMDTLLALQELFYAFAGLATVFGKHVNDYITSCIAQRRGRG